MAPEAEQRPDNILFVFSDQHRHDVMGCAGHQSVATPTLDRVASEGVRFTRTWCQSPICQPSRASLIT
ncbi:MAG: sulfatase-like hydrolase/transferase, partial [Acidimicrobiales bacterium]